MGIFWEPLFISNPKKEESGYWVNHNRIGKDNFNILLNILTVKEEFYQEESRRKTYYLLICY